MGHEHPQSQQADPAVVVFHLLFRTGQGLCVALAVLEQEGTGGGAGEEYEQGRQATLQTHK